MMKKYFKYLCLVAAACSLTACDDFFNPETEDQLDGDDYMSSLTEMYTGYLGIMTKMQAIGDKSIYLTDTRGELLEPTDRSVADLISIYNYNDDLSGNSYADPATYYDLVIACNDYLNSMLAFKEEHPELIAQTEYFEPLISSTLRVKAWTYLTIAEIYGQVLWFDDPIHQIEDIKSAERFELLDIDQTVDRCIDLMNNGYKGYDAMQTFPWLAFMDPDNYTANKVEQSIYRYWDMLTPPWEGIVSKLYLWKGAALDAAGQHETAVQYYKAVSDNLLAFLNTSYAKGGSPQNYALTEYKKSGYSSYWDNSGKNPYARTAIGVITYDYTKNQTNQLLYHFSNEYPNKYLLRPTQLGMDRWNDEEFNPGVTREDASEKRPDTDFKTNDGEYYIAKYRPVGSTKRVNAYEDDVCIYTFRTEDYIYMLFEALNGQGRYVAADVVMNSGFSDDATDPLRVQVDSISNYADSCSLALKTEWAGFNNNWTKVIMSGSTLKYPYKGMRKCLQLQSRTLRTEQTEEARAYNDSLLACEYVLEFPAEGKTYPALIRLARRHHNLNLIESFVLPKYEESGKAARVKSAIESTINGVPGYFVPWDLQVK
jgi:hypothetical protein